MAGLNLRKEKVGLVLKKRDLIDVTARVGFAVDASGSMEFLYGAGVVQDAVERFLAIALRMDDDGSMDVWPFDHRAGQPAAATERNFAGYVDREIRFERWRGGTAYTPPLAAARDHWFPRPGLFGGLFGGPKRRDARPALLLFLTDGDNAADDKPRATALLARAEAEGVPLYVSFIGLGAPHAFGFIREVAAERGNVGFLAVEDIARVSDDDLYERLVTEELAAWLRAAPRGA